MCLFVVNTIAMVIDARDINITVKYINLLNLNIIDVSDASARIEVSRAFEARADVARASAKTPAPAPFQESG